MPVKKNTDYQTTEPEEIIFFSSKSVSNIFLCIGLVFGITFIFLVPPLQAPDEWMHFRRAYYTSEGKMHADKYFAPALGISAVGGMLPESYLIAVNCLFYSVPYNRNAENRLLRLDEGSEPDDPAASGRRFGRQVPLSLLKQPVKTAEETTLLPFPYTSLQLPHLYFPQAAGIAVARWLGQPVVVRFYLGRLFNLLVWLILAWLAIRISPGFNRTLMLIALTPTSLFQASSLSADALTNGIALLLTATILKAAYDEKTGNKNVVAAFILSVLISVSKSYFGLLLLFLLIVISRDKKRRHYWKIFAVLVAITAAVMLLWANWMKDYSLFNNGVSPRKQLALMIDHPVAYLGILYKTVALLGRYYFESFSGRLGHFSVMLPGWLSLFHVVVLGVVAVTDVPGKIMIGARGKMVILLSLVVSILWLFSSQYLSWTPVGARMIDGVQGRYFIPLAPMIFLLLGNCRRQTGTFTNKFDVAVPAYSSVILTVSCYVIYSGYY